MHKRLFFLSIIPVILASCLNKDKEPDKKDIYANYFISGEEGKEFVTVFFQFSNGPEALASVLPQPAKVFLDDKLLTPDSTKRSGVFYEMQIPVDEFTGAHTIRFINEDKKEYREEFSFTPFRVLKPFDGIVNRNEMVVNVEGLRNQDLVRVVMTDTSFKGEGVNEMDTVKNNQLDLRKFLPAITNGPVILHLFKEEERNLHNGQRGKISITYGLKREFELKD